MWVGLPIACGHKQINSLGGLIFNFEMSTALMFTLDNFVRERRILQCNGLIVLVSIPVIKCKI